MPKSTSSSPELDLPAGSSAHTRAENIHIMRGDREILTGLYLTVSAGSRLAVVGENGSGKTTLLHVLAGTLPPDQGELRRSGTVTLLEQALDADDNRTVGDLINESLRQEKAALAALDATVVVLGPHGEPREPLGRPALSSASGRRPRLEYRHPVARRTDEPPRRPVTGVPHRATAHPTRRIRPGQP
ncbi:MAG: ATP-binding cassette domain-containing protein [Brevibacterium aurantiacum]|nr:ATP-binding cassette domain-containing protein [Brevibacterium aurantiacum]